MAANGDAQNIPLPPGDDDFEEDEAGGQHVNAVPPPPPAGANQQPHVHHFNPYAQQFNPWMPPFGPGPWQMPPHPFQQHVAHPQQQQNLPQPHKVKLPPFWPAKPKVWFTTVEAEFGTYYVNESRARFNLVIKALSEEAMERAAAIVEDPDALADPYGAIKARLLEAYQMDPWESCSRLLHFRELGELKPSQMMDSMLALYRPEHLFKAIFLGRLPSDMRDHVQREASRLGCRELAAYADTIWQSRNATRANVLASLPLPPTPDPVTEDLSEAVAAVKISGGKKPFSKVGKKWSGAKRQPPRQGGPKESDKKGGSVCWRHLKFREKAWGCEDPACYLFPGN